MSTAEEQELKAELTPPFVDIDGLANFRDIGGLPIESSNGSTTTVRKGVFYRGPDTSTVTLAGIAKLKELHVKTDFDLRSKGQIEKAGGATEMEGIQRIWCPAFPDGEYSPEKAAARYVQYASDGTEGIVEAFTDILIHGAPACRTILLHVCSLNPPSSKAGTPDVPDSAFYIHCTTGNNRSGVFIGVILSLLGVKPQHIAEEYALSEIGLRPTRDQVVARLMKSPVFAGAGGGGKARAQRMVGARPESMLAMLEMVNRKWGSAEGYVKSACGLTNEEVEKVKQVLIYTEVKAPKSTAAGGHKRSRSFVARLWGSLSKPKRSQ